LIQPDVLRCSVLHVDRFGNLISNLTRQRFEEHLNTSKQQQFVLRVGQYNVPKLSNSYAEGEKGELIALFGSSGLLEFSVNQGMLPNWLRLDLGEYLFKVA